MVRASRALLLKDGGNISKALSDFLVCPLSKQPSRRSQDFPVAISLDVKISDGFLELCLVYGVDYGIRGTKYLLLCLDMTGVLRDVLPMQFDVEKIGVKETAHARFL